MTELKPCPFCGGEAEEKTFLTAGTAFVSSKHAIQIVCKSCRAESTFFKESVHYSARDKAIEAWNRRVKDEAD